MTKSTCFTPYPEGSQVDLRLLPFRDLRVKEGENQEVTQHLQNVTRNE